MTTCRPIFYPGKIKRSFVAVCMGILFFSCHSASQTFNKNRIDSYFDSLEKHNKFMGSVAVAKNGSVIYTRTTGFSDVANGTKSNPGTRYRIGSISKTFTTVLIMKAVEENRLKLSQTLDTWFPGITHAAKISLNDLLYHRSGIHNFTSNPAYTMLHTTPKTREQLVTMITQGGSDFEPGTKSDYSNSNFVLLSLVLEKVYQKTYAELLTEKIIQPIGLKSTYYGGKIDVSKNESYSYKPVNGWEKMPETDMSIPLGAGAIVSTPTDLVVFAESLFNGKLISMERLAHMEMIKDRFGMGIMPIPFYGKSSYGHGGAIDGFSSLVTYFPEERVAFAYTSNGTNFNNNDITIAVLSAVFDRPYELPSFSAATVSPERLSVYTGSYTSSTNPLKIAVFVTAGKLMAQATGQSAFALDYTGNDGFSYPAAGIVLTFRPDKKEMTLLQAGRSFIFTKE